MSDYVLEDEDTDILDEYFEAVHDMSAKPVFDYDKREKLYTTVAALISGRVDYINECDPNKDNGATHARSVAYTLAILLGALSDCPDMENHKTATLNINYFLDCLYKQIGDPMVFSFVTFSGLLTLMGILGISGKPEKVQTADIVDLVTKAKTDGRYKIYKTGEGGTVGAELTESEMDDIIGDFMGGDHGTIH